MIGAAQRYRELLLDLLFERELAGGTLPDQVESARVDELDRCWWAMTSDEQDAFEASVGSVMVPDAPRELDDVDVQVVEGSTGSPRAKAA